MDLRPKVSNNSKPEEELILYLPKKFPLVCCVILVAFRTEGGEEAFLDKNGPDHQ